MTRHSVMALDISKNALDLVEVESGKLLRLKLPRDYSILGVKVGAEVSVSKTMGLVFLGFNSKNLVLVRPRQR